MGADRDVLAEGEGIGSTFSSKREEMGMDGRWGEMLIGGESSGM